MKKNAFFLMMLMTALLVSCTTQDEPEVTADDATNARALLDKIFLGDDLTSKRPQPPVWADCEVFSAIVPPAEFKPKGKFDELYMMPDAAFKDGVPLISDSKPGDQDYNGGRWHLNVLKAGVDPAKYVGACLEEDLDPNDFESTDVYFECPLRPRKN